MIVTLGVPTGAVLDTSHGTHTLTINDNESKPTFSTPTVSRVVALNAASVFFSATAEGLPTPKVDWLYNNRVVAGFTNQPSLGVLNVQLANAGTIAAKATNTFGSLTSTAQLVVVDTRDKNIVYAVVPTQCCLLPWQERAQRFRGAMPVERFRVHVTSTPLQRPLPSRP